MLAALPALNAQGTSYRPAPNYVAGGKADQAEGARILGEFRETGLAGTYWLSFELRVLPRQGEERVLAGELFGAPGEAGPLTRLSVGSTRWLIQSGTKSAAWIQSDKGPVHAATPAETLQPVAGTDFTLFDLQMPFLHWTDFVYEGLAKVRGRPAHQFVLYPPAAFTQARPDLRGVRVFLDTQFQAPVQVEQLGPDGKPVKTVTLLDLKKVDGQWLLKSLDLRNLTTRDKTRLTFKAAALNLTLPADTFAPAQLAEPPPTVPRTSIQEL